MFLKQSSKHFILLSSFNLLYFFVSKVFILLLVIKSKAIAFEYFEWLLSSTWQKSHPARRIYFGFKNSDKHLKDFKYIEEKQNKELLKNKLESLIKDINSNKFSDDIDKLLNMISPWHRDAFMEGKIKYDELKDYINKWYNDVYDLID